MIVIKFSINPIKRKGRKTEKRKTLYTSQSNINLKHTCVAAHETSKKPTKKVTKMTKNIENICKIETKGFQDLCRRYGKLEEENKQLTKDNTVLGHELTYFKEYAADLEDEVNKLKARCRELSRENHDLSIELRDMKFTRKYLTSGHEFARSLLGHKQTNEELAIEAAENGYKPYVGDDY